MAISLDTATRLNTDLVRVLKLFQSMRQHAPRLHPGVEPASYPILFNLIDEPRRVSMLAECVYSDVSTVSRQVTTLVSHGLLDKLADPHDGRAWVVSLSAEGAELVERLKAGRAEWFRRTLKDWDPADADAFGDYLERFATSFEASRAGSIDLSKAQPKDLPKAPATDTPKASLVDVPNAKTMEVSR